MRTRSLLAGLLALTLAGCAGAASQAPSAELSPQSSVPSPAMSQEPPVILGVTVHWDGTRCTYLGPAVVLDGTTAKFEYTFDEGTDAPLLIINGVKPGTTWDMVIEGASAVPLSKQIPDWVVMRGIAQIDPGTSALYAINSDIGGTPVGGYYVGCHTAPVEKGGTDMAYPAALLLIAGP